jgi:hypothetical protein
MKINYSITLNPCELAMGNYCGEERYKCARANGVVCQKIAKRQDVVFVDRNGANGEIAGCRFNNVYPDLSIAPQRGTYDAMILGWKVDFKTTEYPTGRLTVKLGSEDSDVEIYYLITGDYTASPVYRMRGWAWAKDVWSHSNIGRLPGQDVDTHILTQEQLQPVEWLLNPYNHKGRRDIDPSIYHNNGADRT